MLGGVKTFNNGFLLVSHHFISMVIVHDVSLVQRPSHSSAILNIELDILVFSLFNAKDMVLQSGKGNTTAVLGTISI